MKKDIHEKIKEEIELIINPIKNEWRNKSEKELEILLKNLGYVCRSETSIFRNKILSDTNLANTLLEIGKKYNKNSKILIEFVSSINNMYSRYKLEITDAIFEFLIELTKNKKVNFYVSIFITDLPQFSNCVYKWDYILSIPDIVPKDKSILTFYRVINHELAVIPDNLKSNIAGKFRLFLEKPSLHEATVKKYLDIIGKLE
jgi:hypothetical protein